MFPRKYFPKQVPKGVPIIFRCFPHISSIWKEENSFHLRSQTVGKKKDNSNWTFHQTVNDPYRINEFTQFRTENWTITTISAAPLGGFWRRWRSRVGQSWVHPLTSRRPYGVAWRGCGPWTLERRSSGWSESPAERWGGPSWARGQRAGGRRLRSLEA